MSLSRTDTDELHTPYDGYDKSNHGSQYIETVSLMSDSLVTFALIEHSLCLT